MNLKILSSYSSGIVSVVANLNSWGVLNVTPLYSLKKTAQELSKIIKVQFFEDDSGRYEEFPAYCAMAYGCELSLLGIPDEEDYLGDEPLDSFHLQIKNIDMEIDKNINIAIFFLEIISQSDNLRCDLAKE